MAKRIIGIALNRYMNRQGQVWIRIFPDKPITRMTAGGQAMESPGTGAEGGLASFLLNAKC